ncbi:MAG: STAS/SEC14 domain-containing protein [Candidatus Competibacteraceae bacterium]|nr:STAS/SEC14 domain-containing protein [Candidatus Competibacteraceae bacterium]
MRWDEFQAFLAEAETRRVFAAGQVRLLIQLEDFSGWEPGDEWGDVSFFFKHDADIEKIAVVGDPRWREDMLIFLFADYRRAEARFFTETGYEEAYAWLSH